MAMQYKVLQVIVSECDNLAAAIVRSIMWNLALRGVVWSETHGKSLHVGCRLEVPGGSELRASVEAEIRETCARRADGRVNRPDRQGVCGIISHGVGNQGRP
jgi:hypothetical protein